MNRPTFSLPSIKLFAAFSFLAASLSCESGRSCGNRAATQQTAPNPSSQKIKHVVIIFQENRTPDNLFHSLPNADIANAGQNSLGQTVPLTPISLSVAYDLDHSHGGFMRQYDGGKMDKLDQNKIKCTGGGTSCAPSNPGFKYVNPAEVAPYFQMAEQYTFCDRMFQTNQGPSFPAHQIIISGTSAPTTDAICSTSFAFVGTRSIRAARTAWTVPGTRMSSIRAVRR